MRYEITASFRADYRRLSLSERELFKAAVRVFSEAADLRMDDPSLSWPAKLRVRGIHRARGVYEMTWSFSGPDGRATWEWVSLTDEAGERQVAVRWRRIGDHAIFARP